MMTTVSTTPSPKKAALLRVLSWMRFLPPASAPKESFVLTSVKDVRTGAPLVQGTFIRLKKIHDRRAQVIAHWEAKRSQLGGVSAHSNTHLITGSDPIIGIQPLVEKDAVNGYPGLTALKINFKNAMSTVTSFFTNANTKPRTYIFPDKDITVAGLSDIETATNTFYMRVPKITDAALLISDVTANNVTTTQHGFAPKLPNDATKYLDGQGNYTVPAGGGGGGITAAQAFAYAWIFG